MRLLDLKRSIFSSPSLLCPPQSTPTPDYSKQARPQSIPAVPNRTVSLEECPKAKYPCSARPLSIPVGPNKTSSAQPQKIPVVRISPRCPFAEYLRNDQALNPCNTCANAEYSAKPQEIIHSCSPQGFPCPIRPQTLLAYSAQPQRMSAVQPKRLQRFPAVRTSLAAVLNFGVSLECPTTKLHCLTQATLPPQRLGTVAMSAGWCNVSELHCQYMLHMLAGTT